jgi:hypothetical protein
MEEKQENVDVPKDEDASAKKEAFSKVKEAYKKYQAGEYDLDTVPYEDRVDLEIDFRMADELVPVEDSDLTKFRKKNMLSIGL